MDNYISVVMYHYVRDLALSRYPDIKGLTVKQFKEQIDFFSQNFNVITMEQLLEAKYCGGRLPQNPLLLTFDDAYIDHFTYVLPILKEYNFQGTFSVPCRIIAENKVLDVNKIHFILASGVPVQIILNEIFKLLDYYRGTEFDIEENNDLFNKLAVANRFDTKEVIFIKRLLQHYLPEKLRNIVCDRLFKEVVGVDEGVMSRELYLTYDQIKCMRSMGMYFCNHGYDHYWMDKLDENQMKVDIDKALQYWDGIIDKKQWTMCYPYGSHNSRVIEYVKSRNCVAAFSTNVDIFNIGTHDIYSIPRLDTNDFPPKSNNYINIKNSILSYV